LPDDLDDQQQDSAPLAESAQAAAPATAAAMEAAGAGAADTPAAPAPEPQPDASPNALAATPALGSDAATDGIGSPGTERPLSIMAEPHPVGVAVPSPARRLSDPEVGAGLTAAGSGIAVTVDASALEPNADADGDGDDSVAATPSQPTASADEPALGQLADAAEPAKALPRLPSATGSEADRVAVADFALSIAGAVDAGSDVVFHTSSGQLVYPPTVEPGNASGPNSPPLPYATVLPAATAAPLQAGGADATGVSARVYAVYHDLAQSALATGDIKCVVLHLA